MAGTDELLRSLLRLIRGVCGSKSASLCVSGSSPLSAQPLLVHDGEPSSLPELADLPSATRFLNNAKLSKKNEKSSALMQLDIVESRRAGAYLLRIPDLESLLASTSAPAPERREREPDSPEPRHGSVSAWIALRPI